jgi:hypothetical protein
MGSQGWDMSDSSLHGKVSLGAEGIHHGNQYTLAMEVMRSCLEFSKKVSKSHMDQRPEVMAQVAGEDDEK